MNLTKEIHGFAVTLRWAYADLERVFVYYTVEGPPDHSFSSFVMKDTVTTLEGVPLRARGALPLDLRDGVAHYLAQYGPPPGAISVPKITLRFHAPGLTAYEDVDAIDGTPPPYPGAVVGTPEIGGDPGWRGIPVPDESDTQIAVYYGPGDPMQFVVVPGAIDFEFTVPIDAPTRPGPATPPPPRRCRPSSQVPRSPTRSSAR
ncbi:MAG: hypothetical protein QJR03_03420 [Sphaerobacter sp.]|nr:hypothetical protein [Sphaerobacter sp.]